MRSLAFDGEAVPDEQLGWLFLAATAAHYAWDDDRLEVLSARHVELARSAGALSDIPLALSSRAIALLFVGDLTGAAAVVDELQVAQDATGSSLAPYAALGLAALRGDYETATGADREHRGGGAGAR